MDKDDKQDFTIERLQHTFEDHDKDDKARFELHENRFERLEVKLDTLISKLDDFIKFVDGLGTWKKILIAIAVIIGAIVTIGSGFKTIISWWK